MALNYTMSYIYTLCKQNFKSHFRKVLALAAVNDLFQYSIQQQKSKQLTQHYNVQNKNTLIIFSNIVQY